MRLSLLKVRLRRTHIHIKHYKLITVAFDFKFHSIFQIFFINSVLCLVYLNPLMVWLECIAAVKLWMQFSHPEEAGLTHFNAVPQRCRGGELFSQVCLKIVCLFLNIYFINKIVLRSWYHMVKMYLCFWPPILWFRSSAYRFKQGLCE